MHPRGLALEHPRGNPGGIAQDPSGHTADENPAVIATSEHIPETDLTASPGRSPAAVWSAQAPGVPNGCASSGHRFGTTTWEPKRHCTGSVGTYGRRKPCCHRKGRNPSPRPTRRHRLEGVQQRCGPHRRRLCSTGVHPQILAQDNKRGDPTGMTRKRTRTQHQ